MLNLLFAGDVTNNLWDLIANPTVIISLALAIVGVVFACIAKRVARAVRKTKDIKPDDKIVITLKVLGLVFIVVALVLLVIATVQRV